METAMSIKSIKLTLKSMFKAEDIISVIHITEVSLGVEFGNQV